VLSAGARADAGNPASIPQLTAPPDVTVRSQERIKSRHGEILRLRFQTSRMFNGSAPDGVSQVFEKQLAAAGWKQLEADTSNEVFVSAWRHNGARLLLSILQLHQTEYSAAFELLLD
jgi:hypothetical protein